MALQASALSLGEPTLQSAPGEPLDVSIPVLCGTDECEHFEAALGGTADYRAARVPEPQLRGGQLGLAYDRALDAIRVRSAAPLPAQSLHLLLDLRAGAISLRKDVMVVVPAAARQAAEAEPAVPRPAPVEAAAAPVVQDAPASTPVPVAHIPAAPAHGAAPAAVVAQQQRSPDAGAQALGLLKSLDPVQIAIGAGIGAGLLLAWLVLRFLRQVYGYWAGRIRYRWAERKRERDRVAAAAQLPSAAPLASRRAAASLPGIMSATPTLREDLKDDLARRLRQQIEAEPQRLDLKLKLAERLFALQDGEAYTNLVMALKPELKETAWERLRRLGQQLRPYDDRFLNLGDRGEVNTVPLMKSDY